MQSAVQLQPAWVLCKLKLGGSVPSDDASEVEGNRAQTMGKRHFWGERSSPRPCKQLSLDAEQSKEL